MLLELDPNKLDFFENSSLREIISTFCKSFFFLHFSVFCEFFFLLHFSFFKDQIKDSKKCIKPNVQVQKAEAIAWVQFESWGCSPRFSPNCGLLELHRRYLLQPSPSLLGSIWVRGTSSWFFNLDFLICCSWFGFSNSFFVVF